jgi:hypothetical protein
MNWAKERDLLIAQTMTFVQSVTGTKLEAEAQTETRIEFASLNEIEKVERPIKIVERPIQSAQTARSFPAPRKGAREEIQDRVAAFRAHQQLFDRERDAYFNATLTKVRGSIKNQPNPPGD